MWDFQDFFILAIRSSLRSFFFCFVPPPTGAEARGVPDDTQAHQQPEVPP